MASEIRSMSISLIFQCVMSQAIIGPTVDLENGNTLKNAFYLYFYLFDLKKYFKVNLFSSFHCAISQAIIMYSLKRPGEIDKKLKNFKVKVWSKGPLI